ncbi:hypothetical protein AVEN_36207-1 [Araneus ventricosus]|uniref:Uncharacterized protein n=1 Tax=Araneus ventricosus TaxID=182803 RepID=A0A4Y2KHY9_ARAVE|nr:hypothetical protein AVEN_36207-1 [Araneus ventricosus]
MWSGRLDNHPVPISISPFGLPGDKIGSSRNVWRLRLVVRGIRRKWARVGNRSDSLRMNLSAYRFHFQPISFEELFKGRIVTTANPSSTGKPIGWATTTPTPE